MANSGTMARKYQYPVYRYMAKKSNSSKRWLQEHDSDPYVQRAHDEGYRGRAAFKLIEMSKKYRLIKPGQLIVDLGAAPGSWSQVAARQSRPGGRVVASDILPMAELPDVRFVQGDFREETVLEELLAELGAEQADLVISDMAPNMSGVKSVDQPAAMYLVELSLDLCRQVLRPGGDFLVKLFHGEGFDAFVNEARASFGSTTNCKPDASRARSREVYLLARNFRSSV